MPLVSPPPVQAPAPPASTRTRALLEQVRRLPPEGRRKVLAQMELAVAQASPANRPAMEDLLRQVRAAAEEPAPKEGSAPPLAASLERYRKLSPEQRRKVLAQMEAEAAKAPPSAKPGFELLLRQMRAEGTEKITTKSAKDRIQSSIENYRSLDAEGRAKVLAQLERDAASAPPDLKKTLEALIGRLKAL